MSPDIIPGADSRPSKARTILGESCAPAPGRQLQKIKKKVGNSMTAFARVTKSNLSEQIASSLEEMILSQKLKSGASAA